jgi:hypothetical protein
MSVCNRRRKDIKKFHFLLRDSKKTINFAASKTKQDEKGSFFICDDDAAGGMLEERESL